MASIRQSIRSSTASKRPTSAIADGQIALNTASGTPGMFFKDSAGNIIKAGPAHYGASAPNSSPAVGGSTGNSIGEAWLDSSLTPAGWKIWNGSAFVNATPLSSDTVQGLVELATNAETQAGADAARAVTSAGLQSKVSDSISTASSSGIASSSAVKTAYDLANAALPKSGGIITGNLEIGSTGSFTFEGSTADGFETTLAVVDPTLDRTITFPNITGTVVTTGDTGTVTSAMILDGTIVDADINSSAAIAFSKLASLASANILVGNASGVPTSTAVTGDVTITNAGVTAIASNVIVNADINSAAAIAYSKLALSSGITNTDISASAAIAYSKLALSSGITNTDISASAAVAYGKLALSNSIVNADINSAAAIAGTKISPNFGSQNLTTTGNITATNHIAASGTATIPSIQVGTGTTYNTGIYSPGADQLAISTNGAERLRLSSTGEFMFKGAGTTPGTDKAVYFSGSAPVNSVVLDPSGRLLVGTSTSALEKLVVLGDGGGIQINRNQTASPTSGQTLGSIGFKGVVSANPNADAEVLIQASADENHSGLTAGSRLEFHTKPNGVGPGSSPTERMRISADGTVLMMKTAFGLANAGFQFRPGVGGGLTNIQNPALYLNRLGSDGTIVSIQQDSVEEGTISVSGTTVSYNGAHLSRWSQLPSGAERTEILRGSVLSNLDEMCEWGQEDNEQLNRMKVSDVEGDKNVSGVFQTWDDDDDTYTDDFYCAMTGDFIIRIAEGVTVERGDLLMSAGDGTAKPQDDDIIRSKTIAKVTSTNVSCTYEDGSYCVPCVLMAC